jgi:hypothetical protein
MQKVLIIYLIKKLIKINFNKLIAYKNIIIIIFLRNNNLFLDKILKKNLNKFRKNKIICKMINNRIKFLRI